MQNQEKSLIRILIDHIKNRATGIECTGMSGSEKAYLVAQIYSQLSLPVLLILPSVKEAELFLEDLNFFLDIPEASALYFPPYDILSFQYLSARNETAANRIRTLYRLTDATSPPFLVTTVDALLRKVIPKQEMTNYTELLMVGEDIDRDLLVKKLTSGGYNRSVIVEEPGEFCIRGGILDVFCPLYQTPLRVEFFGDTVDTLRFFSSETQRTSHSAEEAILIPASETIFKPETRDETVRRIREQAAELDVPARSLRDNIECIKHQEVFPGMEGWIPLMYRKLDTLFDYVPSNTLFLVSEPGNLQKVAEGLEKQLAETYETDRREQRFCIPPNMLYTKWENVRQILQEKKPVTLKMLRTSAGGANGGQLPLQIHFSVKDNSSVRDDLKHRREKENLLLPLAEWIWGNSQSGRAPLLVCGTRVQADRLISLLTPYRIQPLLINKFSDFRSKKETVYICLGHISSGFVWPDECLAVFTEDEIFGAKRRRTRAPRRQVRTDLLSFDELKKQDLVVHMDHGIGQYQGLEKLTVNGATNDFLLIKYRGDDKLYLPIDRMNMIQKYIGVDGIEPTLDKMGGKSWERVKHRIKRSVEKIAGKLLKLYASRKVKRGVSFGKPDAYFKDFEAAFPYEETIDQIKAIEDVLVDMGNAMPMDRLVCGDVGYGKTEVALRASFVSIFNGKQTAMLVPTTVLAEQHYNTFVDRFENYPVNIDCLSRFRSTSEQREIVSNLKTGKTDIVIGTHRLLQKDVVFKDLGLLIIDEEQRFGVKHKEKLKQLRSTVDVLALTATPIPRTLHMSLMGIRDISVISTPPEHRHPILTYVTEFDDEVIVTAIQKELDRNGQIFFVHNNIYNIEAMANYLQQLVPEVRIDIAHGRMSETALEDVMLRFLHREIDMLVCTTIIESGLDIPSANTIFVNRADRFGLAQMYQLRGRVGRADEQAYAYLFIPRNHSLGKDAQKRLRVLLEHSDLGSGFQIAMSDLNIRGGGTVLGASQSGHIAAVGYDMFLQLMEDAITTLKGEPISEPLEPEINISLSAFIPESYIPDIDQRLFFYRRLARVTEPKEVAAFKEELLDRFGPLPTEVQNLLIKIILKTLSKHAGVKKLELAGRQLTMQFSETHMQNPKALVDMILSKQECFEFAQNHGLKASLSQQNQSGVLEETKNILKEIAQRVNA
jgi:transcription-repair coupling factor (superfamily II helicase)